MAFTHRNKRMDDASLLLVPTQLSIWTLTPRTAYRCPGCAGLNCRHTDSISAMREDTHFSGVGLEGFLKDSSSGHCSSSIWGSSFKKGIARRLGRRVVKGQRRRLKLEWEKEQGCEEEPSACVTICSSHGTGTQPLSNTFPGKPTIVPFFQLTKSSQAYGI